MSRGKNRADINYQSIYEGKQSYNKCIFISHKYEDLDAAKEIAKYIMDSGIDVYLDCNDNGLQKAVNDNDSEKIVECIETAIGESTHILVLITENTRKSWWVPYETGYAKKANKHIASLLLKGVDEFPDYLKIECTLTGYESLAEYISNIEPFHLFLEQVAYTHRNSLLNFINEN